MIRTFPRRGPAVLGCGLGGLTALVILFVIGPTQLLLRLRVDEEQLAAECAWLRLTKPPGEYQYILSRDDPGYEGLPAEVKRTGARVYVGHESVFLEHGGGFRHFGLYVGPPPKVSPSSSIGYRELGSGVWFYDEWLAR